MWGSRFDVKIDVLPAEVSAAIEEAWIVYRSAGYDEDGEGSKLFFALPGYRLADVERSEEILKKIFPELIESQLGRAIKFLDARCQRYLREYAETQFGENRPKNSCRRCCRPRQNRY